MQTIPYAAYGLMTLQNENGLWEGRQVNCAQDSNRAPPALATDGFVIAGSPLMMSALVARWDTYFQKISSIELTECASNRERMLI